MNYKNILNEINLKQIENFYTIDNFIDGGTSILPRNKRGLYWIWTSLTDEQLAVAKYNEMNSEKCKHINIPDMIAQRKSLKQICNLKHPFHQDFRVIYNGIGGYKSNSKNSSGLRERILQEFNATSKGTGTLSIESTGLQKSNFGISFFNFDDENNKIFFDFLKDEEVYLKYASDLEKLWRLEFGHPILCRH